MTSESVGGAYDTGGEVISAGHLALLTVPIYFPLPQPVSELAAAMVLVGTAAICLGFAITGAASRRSCFNRRSSLASSTQLRPNTFVFRAPTLASTSCTGSGTSHTIERRCRCPGGVSRCALSTMCLQLLRCGQSCCSERAATELCHAPGAREGLGPQALQSPGKAQAA